MSCKSDGPNKKISEFIKLFVHCVKIFSVVAKKLSLNQMFMSAS